MTLPLQSIENSLPSSRFLTALLPLFLLSTSATLQPWGKILNQGPRHSRYLHASPIFCLASIISLILHLAHYISCKAQGQDIDFLDVISHLAPEKPLSGNAKPPSAMQMLRSVLVDVISSPVLAAVVGGYLVMLEGENMFWTRVWAGCFMLCIPQSYWTGVFEKLGRHQSSASSSSSEKSTPATPTPTPTLERPLASLDGFLFFSACSVHGFGVLYLIVQLWPGHPHPWISNTGWATPDTAPRAPFSLPVSLLLTVLIDLVTLMTALIPVVSVTATYSIRKTYSRQRLWMEVLWCLSSMAGIWGLVWAYGSFDVLLDWVSVGAFVGLPIGAWNLLMWWGIVYEGPSEIMLLCLPREKEQEVEMDGWACGYFVGIGYTAVLTTLYYAFRF